MFEIEQTCSHIEDPVLVSIRFRSIKESITQQSQNSNEMNNDTWNTRTRGTLLQRSTLQLGISVDIKRKRRRSDPVLWQNPLYQQKIRKPKDNTHKRHQKLRLHNDCGPTAYCCICKRPGPKLVVVPPECKTRVFVHQNILIPAGSRCCPVHIKDHTLTEESISMLKSTYDESLLNRTTIVDMLQRMRDICKRHEKTRLDFDSRHTLNDADYIELTGLSLSAFDEVCSIIKDSVKNTPVRSQRCSVAIFFCKMRSGLSNKFLATLFNVSKSSIRRALSTVRKVLMATFVPDNLGFDHGRLRSITIVKFGSVICARPVVNVIEQRFVTLVELSILQHFGVAYFLNFFRFEA